MKAILATLISIPLSQPTNWQVLSFKNIPSHKVEYTKMGLQLQIAQSASPVIYPLSQKESIFQVEVEGHVSEGALQLKDVKKQGQKKYDDFVLRLGLVAAGSKKLNWAQRTLAPEWIKKIHSLAPKNQGIDKIYFFEVAQDASLIGTRRTHYLSDLLEEEIVVAIQPDGRFRFTKTLPKPMDVVALWISADGDDTQSTFRVTISRIDLFKRP